MVRFHSLPTRTTESKIDVSELERVYGQLTISENQKNGTDSEKVVSLLESQVQDLKAQLDTATKEKAELLNLLSAEKDEKRALMPPADEKPQKSPNWLLRLVGAR